MAGLERAEFESVKSCKEAELDNRLNWPIEFECLALNEKSFDEKASSEIEENSKPNFELAKSKLEMSFSETNFRHNRKWSLEIQAKAERKNQFQIQNHLRWPQIRPTASAMSNLFFLLLSALLLIVSSNCFGSVNCFQKEEFVFKVANKIQTIKSKSSSNPINEWLVNQMAPVMATKLLDNVLETSSGKSKGKSIRDETSKKIDTQILADKIVDKVADSIKRKRIEATASSPEAKSLPATGKEVPERGARKGKSLVSDSVHQVVQNLFSRDNRKFFGRAMEKSKFPMRLSNNNNNWLMIKEPVYDQNLFVSTDSSQLDENPVVLRAEHGHNASTTTSQPDLQQQQQQQQHNLSPLISSLMSSGATNQIGNKLLQKHRLQQKYVHTNRHQQQHLAPKPWPPSSGSSNSRRQQQSPYSLPVTSDINIVQATSSPAPPPMVVTAQPFTSTTTTTTSTTTPSYSSYQQQQQQHASDNQQVLAQQPTTTLTQISPNKFKINNRHQHPSASSWYPNSQQQQRHQYQQHNNYNRFQHHQPTTSTTSTSTTTTTTTTTTTPEPPPQTEPILTETMESLMDLDQQTSSPVSSILSSVAQSALESLSSSSYEPTHSSGYNNSNNSPSSSAHAAASVKGVSSSTTSARHSVISAEAIPTALGAPLYHLTRANFTATSIMGPPPRRSGPSPVSKFAAQYLRKGLNNLSSTIFGRQNKSWAKRLGLSSMLLSGLLYGAAILANPGAPLPTSGLEVLQALAKNKRRGSRENLILPPVSDANKFNAFTGVSAPVNPALLDSNYINYLYQEHQLIPLIEQLLQEQQKIKIE